MEVRTGIVKNNDKVKVWFLIKFEWKRFCEKDRRGFVDIRQTCQEQT